MYQFLINIIGTLGIERTKIFLDHKVMNIKKILRLLKQNKMKILIK